MIFFLKLKVVCMLAFENNFYHLMKEILELMVKFSSLEVYKDKP